MARLLVLTRPGGAPAVLPALELLPHEVVASESTAAGAARHPTAEVAVLDATGPLVEARTLAQSLAELLPQVPVLAVLSQGGLAAVSGQWRVADVVLADAGPAEVDARVRLLAERARAAGPAAEEIRADGLVIDAAGYGARLDGRALNLTYREFELLKHLAQHPGRVFSREELLQDVWGFDYFGGTRTVDVHVRRLRAKLGPDREQMIGTVRNVGYRLDGGAAA